MAFGKGAGRIPQNFRPGGGSGGFMSAARSMAGRQSQQPQYRGISGMVQRAMAQRQPPPARMMPMTGGPEAMPSGFYGGGGPQLNTGRPMARPMAKPMPPPAQPSGPPAMNRQIMMANALRRGGSGRF